MFGLNRSQVLPIGIDVGADTVKMLQLEIVDDRLQLVCAAKDAMISVGANDVQSRTGAALEVINRLLRENEFRGRRAVIALPREMVHQKNLRLPPMPPADTAAALQFEAKNLFPFDTDKATLRHISGGEVRQGTDVKQEVVVLAAKNAEIEQYVEQQHAGGLQLESLDYESCALYRSILRFMRRREDELDVHILVDIGLRRSQVVIGKGHELSLIKPIEIGGQMLREQVAKRLGISLEEAASLRRRMAEQKPGDAGCSASVQEAVHDALRTTMENLAREISLCLRYYSVTFRGSRPTKVRLLGGEANDQQLLQILNSSLAIPVESGRPLQSVDHGAMRASLRQGAMSEWAIAMGLSLKGTDRHFAGQVGRPRGTSMPGQNSESSASSTSEIQSIAARLLGVKLGGAHA